MDDRIVKGYAFSGVRQDTGASSMAGCFGAEVESDIDRSRISEITREVVSKTYNLNRARHRFSERLDDLFGSEADDNPSPSGPITGSGKINQLEYAISILFKEIDEMTEEMQRITGI